MIVLLFILLAISLIGGGKIFSFNDNYISPNYTNAIKGILAVIILLSHMKGYVTLSNNYYDIWFSDILLCIGQLMVAPYLFYSGYGIMESVNRKSNYMRTYPKKRILKTLVHFDAAVLLFIITMSLIGERYPAYNYITCWIGWNSVGNSNWFIFDILVMYSIFYICFLACKVFAPKVNFDKKQQLLMLATFSFLTIILWVVLLIYKKSGWWVDTLMTFPLGAWFSYFRQIFERYMRKRILSHVLLISVFILFMIWKYRFGNDILGISACLFCILLVMFCTKVEINNKYLQWLGVHAFSIYIIQRLPMNIFAHYGLNENACLFAVISIPSALLLAWGYNKMLSLLDSELQLL